MYQELSLIPDLGVADNNFASNPPRRFGPCGRSRHQSARESPGLPLGGRGSYLGTVAGAILITLLQSILSVAQMPEAGRQIIYGVAIAGMLLLYGRSKREA